MRRVGVKRTDSEASDVAVLPPAKRTKETIPPQQSEKGSNFLRRFSSGVWGAVDYIKKSFREWRRPPPLCSSPPPVASSAETPPTPQTTLVQDGWSKTEHHSAVPPGRKPSPPSPPSLCILTPVQKTSDQQHSASRVRERKTEAPVKEVLQFSSQSKQQQQQQPSVLRELQQVRDRDQYNQILFGHRHRSYSPSSPPRSPPLFTPLLRPEVIGPTSPRDTVDTGDFPRRAYTAPHFHSTPSHPLPSPPHFTIPSHQPVLHGSIPSHPLSSHHPKATSTTARSWTFLAARGGSTTQDYGLEKTRVPSQHSSHRSQHGVPSDHHSLQHGPLTAKRWSSKGVQTSTTTRDDPSSVVSRQWLENLKLDHKHAVEDRKALEEVLEKYAHVCREDRMKMEEARVERVRRNLGLITVEEEPDVEEMNLKLTPEQNKKVALATGRGSATECLSERFRIRISRSDLFTLTGLQWLNDEIINFYFNLIAERNSGKISVHVMSSFFYPKLVQAGYSGVRRWTKKVDLFTKDVILVPIHLGMHWCLATIHFSQKQFQYFDSLQGNNPSCLARLRDYLLAEAKDKKQMDYDINGWTYYTPKNIPDQRNGSDCGVFTCMYARHIASGVPFTFTQNDMPRIREHMICEILEQRLF